MYVLDASVVIKWFVEEEGTPIARKILDGHLKGLYTIVAPDLLIYEVSNVLRHNSSFPHRVTRHCIASLFDLGLDIVAPLVDVVLPAIKLAYDKNVTFYDSIYVALAHELGLHYVTADRKLHNKIQPFPRTFLLNDLRL